MPCVAVGASERLNQHVRDLHEHLQALLTACRCVGPLRLPTLPAFKALHAAPQRIGAAREQPPQRSPKQKFRRDLVVVCTRGIACRSALVAPTCIKEVRSSECLSA